METKRLMARDPEAVAMLEDFEKRYPQFRTEVSFESLLDIMEFKPESVVDRISPRAIQWIHTDNDELVPLFEAQSMYAKARNPKKLVVLENMVHDDVYRGEGFKQTMQHASAWFREHLPARQGSSSFKTADKSVPWGCRSGQIRSDRIVFVRRVNRDVSIQWVCLTRRQCAGQRCPRHHVQLR